MSLNGYKGGVTSNSVNFLLNSTLIGQFVDNSQILTKSQQNRDIAGLLSLVSINGSREKGPNFTGNIEFRLATWVIGFFFIFYIIETVPGAHPNPYVEGCRGHSPQG